MAPPREPEAPDLPDELEDADAETRTFEAHRLAHADLAGLDLGRVKIVESRLEHVDLSGAKAHVELRDVEVVEGSWANARLRGAKLRRVTFEKSRLTGLELTDAELQDCVFRDCRLDLASFRFARLERVRFERCVANEVDFAEAALESVAFVECDLTSAAWTRASFAQSELRGCDISGAVNPESLRGVAMPWQDVIAAAAELAAAAGVEILTD